MILAWTKMNGSASWVPVEDFEVCDGSLTSPPELEAWLLMTDGSDDELPLLVMALRLLRRSRKPCPRIEIGSSHPSHRWVEVVRAKGADRIFFAPGLLVPPDRSLDEEIEIASDVEICPRLNVRRKGAGVHSVCGAVGDRLMLASGMMAERCLSDFRSCGYFEGKGRSQRRK